MTMAPNCTGGAGRKDWRFVGEEVMADGTAAAQLLDEGVNHQRSLRRCCLECWPMPLICPLPRDTRIIVNNFCSDVSNRLSSGACFSFHKSKFGAKSVKKWIEI
jgi:hypothetical protein